MKSRESQSVDYVRSRLHYAPDTGIFTWATGGRGIRCGAVAGCINADGYWLIRIGSAGHLAHRLAWFYANGEWPKHQIDHINGEKLDNRLVNLRDVPQYINKQNIRRPLRGNRSGLLGVAKAGDGKWRAQIHLNRRQIYLGVFDCPSAAHSAYLAAKRELHAGCEI